MLIGEEPRTKRGSGKAEESDDDADFEPISTGSVVLRNSVIMSELVIEIDSNRLEIIEIS
ncbi:unnamed protein product [marine sediment metagenome]|uniref:Uncharacterized protein n=1 Tax=marine sediment metagenome TaxID=412755 RepID=X1LAN6_9ZZZZ